MKAIKAVYMKKLGWTEAQVQQQLLRKYNDSEVTNYTEFDRLSIMMYDLTPFKSQFDIDRSKGTTCRAK